MGNPELGSYMPKQDIQNEKQKGKFIIGVKEGSDGALDLSRVAEWKTPDGEIADKFEEMEKRKKQERAEKLEIPSDVMPGTSETIGYNLRNAIFINEESLAKDPDNKIIKERLSGLKIEKAMLCADGISLKRRERIIAEADKKGEKLTEHQLRGREKKFSAIDMHDLIQEHFVDRFEKSREKGNTHDYMEGRNDDLFDIAKLIKAAERLQSRLINEEGRGDKRDYSKEKAPTKKPILEIKNGENEKISFLSFDSFDPYIEPSDKQQEIPRSVEKYLLKKEKLKGDAPSAFTYRETVKEKDWDKSLFSFISSYLEKEGAGTAKQLGIEQLNNLTPKQAIELANQIVIDLTKYNKSDAKKQEIASLTEIKKTKADKSTVLELLKEGQSKRGDYDWEGNVVCRNSASMVKAIFEALKENQIKFNRLRDTYCIIEGGTETYAPKREKKDFYDGNKEGHAWNTFVAVSKDSASAVITDTTWAKRNPKTKKIERLDFTIDRMEPVVNEIGLGLSETALSKEEQLKHILSFYMLKMEKPGDTGGKSSPEEDKQFYATRAIDLMIKQGVQRDLPALFVEAIEQEYLKIANDADKVEIETIYKISQNNFDLDFQNILKNYLKDKQLTDYHADEYIFLDDNLQKIIFEELKFHKDFVRFLKESSKFRVRMREVLPQLFVSFSPMARPEDAEELKYLAGKSPLLRSYGYMITRGELSEKKIKKFFEKARQSLQAINSKKYEEKVAMLDDYQLIKQYDKIDRDMRA